MTKKLKKTLAVFLAVAILLCTAPMSVFAASDYKYTYEIIEGFEDEWDAMPTTVWITGYEGTLPSKLKIPAKIKGYDVTSIEPMAFMGASIKEVVIPEGVCWIEDYAFAKCPNLTKVTLPSTIYSIGNGAFFKDSKLKTVIYNGYNSNWYEMFVGNYNENLMEIDWTWTHYQKDIVTVSREYTMNYKEEAYLTTDFDEEGYTVIWDYCDDGCIYVDNEGYAVAYGKSNYSSFLSYEVLDANGDVIAYGEDIVTVKYTFFQWIIEYLLGGWIWGF